MSFLKFLFMIGYIFGIMNCCFSQDQIIDVIEQAKQSYEREDYSEAVKQLNSALQLINEKLITKLKASFPEPLGGWRADDAVGKMTGISILSGITVKRRYFKEGGGSSVDIEMVTNSMKIGNIKMLFASPSMVHRAGGNLKLSEIANHQCLEKFDPIDRYAELTFVPTSVLIVTIIGQDMKDTKIVSKYAEKIDWDELEVTFP